MAKAVSLCRSLWSRFGWRKTDCPAKTVERGNSFAVFSHKLTAVWTMSVPRSNLDVAAKPSFLARSTYFSRSQLVHVVSDRTASVP